MEMESARERDQGTRKPAARLPPGFHVRRGEKGSIAFNLPISQDRFVRWFLPLFGLPFIAVGLHLVLNEGEAAGLFPLAIGSLSSWFGGYLAIGRLELQLRADRVEWNRIYLRRWKTFFLERGRIAKVGSRVGVRTNGRPTSWCLQFELVPADGGAKRRDLPGFYSEAAILWLGDLLAVWAEAPFDQSLDRSIDNSD